MPHARQALGQHGVRIVRLPVREVADLDMLALSLSQHPRTHFAVVLPALAERDRAAVWAALSGARQHLALYHVPACVL